MLARIVNMFDKTKINAFINQNADGFNELSQKLGMIMMSTAILATVAAEASHHKAVVPNTSHSTPVEEKGGEPVRREKEAEVHETHTHSRINQRTPSRSGRV